MTKTGTRNRNIRRKADATVIRTRWLTRSPQALPILSGLPTTSWYRRHALRTASPHLIHARAPPTIRSADTTSSPGRNAPVGTEAMRFASTHPIAIDAHAHAIRSTQVVGPVRNQVWTPKEPRMPRATNDNGSTTMRTANSWMIAPVMPKSIGRTISPKRIAGTVKVAGETSRTGSRPDGSLATVPQRPAPRG